MSQLENLTNDFLMALDDLGQTLTLTHKVSQTLNAITGDYPAVEQVQSISGVVQTVSKRDIALAPNKYQSSDRSVFIREEDVSVNDIDIDDEIIFDSQEYKIFEKLLTDGIYKIIIRRAQ
jgi:hypothetical protein